MGDTVELIGVVICKPGEDAVATVIENKYEAIRGAVGGCIDVLQLGLGVIAYVHDEALLEGQPWNRMIGGSPIAGNMVVLKALPNGDDGGLNVRETGDVLLYLNEVCGRMEPTSSSIEEYERITGHPAITITTVGPDGVPVTIDPTRSK